MLINYAVAFGKQDTQSKFFQVLKQILSSLILLITMLSCAKQRGEGSRRSLVSEDAAINEDPAATKPLVAQLEIEPPKEDPPSNALAALTTDAPYTGIQRKRRRPVLQL